MDWGELVVDADETFEEGPVRIMVSREQVLCGKTVRLVKVLCSTEESRRRHGSVRTPCAPTIPSCSMGKVRCF